MAPINEVDDRFAVIGMGCRLPPGATSLTSFWRFLLKGGDGLKPLRKDRWDWRKYFDEDQNRPGKTYQPKASYLDGDYRQFDPGAFGISPREASFIDPQQRLLLEIAWEAFEDAGVPLDKASNSLTGVFIGAFCLDHLVHQVQPSNRYLMSSHSTVGASMTIVSNRLSHAFNLRGPSLTLDTACSSSLVALHYACQSLRYGESDMVLAGGVNMMTRPEFPIMMSKGHFLSHHGECRAFDESAAGYARGEGAGILLLKTLRKALEDGDQIHAVIRGSGCNQDGRTDGISLPNSEAQGDLLESLYSRCGVDPAIVDYVEAHGTGTQAGDPAEAGALNRHFSRGRNGRKLPIGSVKTNIGHLEAAAGMAGLFKAIGILKHRQIPKNLHFKNPNPKIPFDEYCLQVVSETTALPTVAEKPSLFIGVNSFGYGGTNAHIVLESAPPQVKKARDAKPEKLSLVPFSAHSEKARRDMAGKIAFQLGQPKAPTLQDVAYTAAFRRNHLDYRAVAIVENNAQLRELLIAASTGQPQPSLVEGVVDRKVAAGGLVFVYTGMGPQWWAMGRELIQDEPIVAETLNEIDGHFKPLAGWSLKEAMLADEKSSRMERTEVAQTANFALQVALTRLWASWGIHPVAVIGHSVGEVASAYIAGVYSLEDAVRVSYHRSRLQQKMAGQGAMLAVGLPEKDAEKLIKDLPGVSVAAINSFQGVTLSGDKEQLNEVVQKLEPQGIFHRFLRVEVAYHSPQMDPLETEMAEVLAGLTPREPKLPLYSTAYGGQIEPARWDAGYWWANVRQAVRFADGMKALLDDGYTSFLEIGPHPVLSASMKECASHLERSIRCHTSLKRKEPELRTLLLTLGDLYCAGHAIDWSGLAPTQGEFLPAPAYPWQRQNFWIESERSKTERMGSNGSVYLEQPLLHSATAWEVEVNKNYFPYLFDHGVQDQTVFAGMGYIESAIVLNQQIHQKVGVTLENVTFEKVLIVDYAKLQFLVSQLDPESGQFVISSRVEGEDGPGQRHCRGRLIPQTELAPSTMDMAALRAECPEKVEKQAFYERLVRRGLKYGPMFQPTVDIQVGEQSFLVRIDGRAVLDDETHPLNPTIFDAAVQPVLFCAKGDRLFVPFAIDRFRYFGRPGGECYAFGQVHTQTETLIEADIWLLTPEGQVLAQATGAACQLIETELQTAEENLYYEFGWKPAALPEAEPLDGSRVLIVASPDDARAAELAVKMPGAVTVDSADALAENSQDRLVVLWGAEENADVFGLNEKVVALLQTAIKSRPEGAVVTFVTQGARRVSEADSLPNLAAYSMGALGLVAQNENETLVGRVVDGASSEEIVAELSLEASGDVAYRNGERFERVLATAPRAKDESKLVDVSVEEPIALVAGVKVKLDALHYEAVDRPEPQVGEIEIRVQRTALNQEDLQKLEGRVRPVSNDGTYFGMRVGMECAGLVTRTGPGSAFQAGDRVAGFVQDGFRSFAILKEGFAIKLPHHLDWQAAGVPVAYLVAYRGLVDLARLQNGERVLIHQATGGVGLAALNIARWIGAEVYATAGTTEKIDYLRTLGVERIYSSRDLDFGERIRQDTSGEGVDVVIGALGGQGMHVGVSLLRAGGRYVETGKKDIAEDGNFPLKAFQKNLIFASVDIDQLLKTQPQVVSQALNEIYERLEDGAFQPLRTQTYEAGEIGAAWKDLGQGAHIGKLLVDFSKGEVEVMERPSVEPVIKSDGTYIVTGGTSGFGLVTGRWLADQGAGRVILVSRSGRKAEGLEDTVRYIEEKGSRLDIRSVDVTDPAQVSELVQAAGEGFTLKGIFHGAMVLDDCLMLDVTAERMNRVMRPKVRGALNLAEAVKSVPGLDFVVFYSSISSVVGNRGQTAYVAANATLDGLAEKMRAEGIPGISVNWGALGEVGVVARDANLELVLSSGGITSLTNEQALTALEWAIRSGKPQLGAFLVDWGQWHEVHPHLAEDSRFREHRIQAGGGDGGGLAGQIRQSLADLSKEERLHALEGHLQEVLAATLRMSKETVPLNRRINEMGVDSLMVLELSLGIKERLGLTFSAMEFLKGPDVRQLASLAETRLWRK